MLVLSIGIIIGVFISKINIYEILLTILDRKLIESQDYVTIYILIDFL